MSGRNVFDIDALRLLDVVARTGSFTAAAAELNYTQSAVSRRILTLEHQVGGPLFERLPRGVRLTPAGEILHRHARTALDLLGHAEAELAALHRGQGGRLRIGSFPTANAALVPAALRDFTAERPGVEVVLTEGRSAELMDRLRDGALDIAVISDYPAGLPLADTAEVVPLLTDELLLALPRDHRLACAGTTAENGTGRPAVDLRELKDERWIEGAGWIAGTEGHDSMLAAAYARTGSAPKIAVRVEEWTGKLGFVAAGLGIALVPALAAPALRPDVVLRSLGESAPRRTVYAALPRDAALPAARALLDHLHRHAAALGSPSPPTAASGDPAPAGRATPRRALTAAQPARSPKSTHPPEGDNR